MKLYTPAEIALLREFLYNKTANWYVTKADEDLNANIDVLKADSLDMAQEYLTMSDELVLKTINYSMHEHEIDLLLLVLNSSADVSTAVSFFINVSDL